MSATLWKRFKQRFPDADFNQFHTGDFFGRNVLFDEGDGSKTAIFEDGDFQPSLYFSGKMKRALGLAVGFPLELTLNTASKLPVPAIAFSDTPHPLGEQITNLQIYVTPNDHFTAKVRDVFVKTQITHYHSHESRRWLSAPSMRYWPQQLNFALWCATTGCGVSQRLLFEDKMKDGKHDVTDSELHLPPQVRAILWFHVYFTVRRILFELGGIQSVMALPGDSTFSQTDNHYDIPSYKRICKEFGVHPSASFRFEKGANHGLGAVYIWYTNEGPRSTGIPYPGNDLFSDEGGKGADGNLIQYIYNEEAAKQYEYFVTPVSHGLSNAGQARINQSIEALVYAVLGAQVNVRSSILGSTGSAQEARREFMVLLEDAVRQPDLAKSVQRFQLAVQEAKVRLDLAISPGTWLMPSRMILNTESVVGYNNELRRAGPRMKLGVNADVNQPAKQVGIIPMAGGPPKTNRPNSHPSNPIHEKSKTGAHTPDMATPHDTTTAVVTTPPATRHEALKIGLIAAGALAVFVMSR